MSSSISELIQIRSWALFVLNHSDNFMVYLNINNIDRKSDLRFLQKSTKYSPSFGYIRNGWSSKQEGNYIVFYKNNNNNKELKSIYIHLFEDKENNNDRLYAGLYDEYGKRYLDFCLVIWNRKYPDITNTGYAIGRCPDYLCIKQRLCN